MITERDRADRRTTVRALAASAAAVVLMVTLTGGVSSEPSTDVPQQLSFAAD